MMAATAIKRLPTPRTGGVRHPCIVCESRGYTAIEKNEQSKLLDLMSETDFLRQGNYRRERKLRKLENDMKQNARMNSEMDDFFTNISIVPIVNEKLTMDFATQTEVEDLKAEKLDEKKKLWREKEKERARELENLRNKFKESSTPVKPKVTIPIELRARAGSQFKDLDKDRIQEIIIKFNQNTNLKILFQQL